MKGTKLSSLSISSPQGLPTGTLRLCALRFVVVLILNFIFSTFLFAQSTFTQCKATLIGDTLVLENSLIKRTYNWNNGNLKSYSLTDKHNGHILKLAGKAPDQSFPGAGNPVSGKLTVTQVAATPISTAFLQAEVEVKLGALEVKKIFRIYPDCPAIACDYYLKGTLKAQWTGSAASKGDLKNIETNSTAAIPQGVSVMETLALPGKHWNVKATQFFDITDQNNTLVQEHEQLLYRSESRIAGNVLFADETGSGQGIFILKEAPSSDVQLAYPGADFLAQIGKIQALGVGVNPSDLSPDKWTRCYGFVTGVTNGGRLGQLSALRSYQQQVRLHQPGRDDMVMMNTWGDRSQDKHIGETFTINELKAAHRLGITHFQIDDGWQSGRSANSAFAGGTLTKIWDNPNYWKPDPVKFPHGLGVVIQRGKALGINVCLWFNPSKDDSYAHWQNDAEALISLYKTYGINTFKIDGVQVTDKKGEVNLRKMFDTVMLVTNNQAVFNLDVTAGRRYGYHYFNTYGNIFLENRYTDWSNYYPHWTLRNLWMLSAYVPPQNLQIEFLNNYRNADKYDKSDQFAPSKVSMEYEFALTLMAQPLAWMEATGLPEKAFTIAPVIKKYQQVQSDIHAGQIFPIGEQPSGASWTGFQSIKNKEGYLLIIRELNKENSATIRTFLPAGKKVSFKKVLGDGADQTTIIKASGDVSFSLLKPNSYVLYKYKVI
jgi:alpha-galactosidase